MAMHSDMQNFPDETIKSVAKRSDDISTIFVY